MKRAVYTAAAVLLIACLDATATAQNAQEHPPDVCFAPGCVTAKYDKFQGRTIVMMHHAVLTSDALENSLTLSVAYSSPGAAIRRPDEATFLFTTTAMGKMPGQTFEEPGEKTQAFETRKGVYLLIDGTPHPLGDVILLKSEETASFPRAIRTYHHALVVPFKVLDSIAAAKSVEIRAGSIETSFDENMKAAFRRLVELVPKEEPKPKPPRAGERKPPPKAKTTPPARISQPNRSRP